MTEMIQSKTAEDMSALRTVQLTTLALEHSHNLELGNILSLNPFYASLRTIYRQLLNLSDMSDQKPRLEKIKRQLDEAKEEILIWKNNERITHRKLYPRTPIEILQDTMEEILILEREKGLGASRKSGIK